MKNLIIVSSLFFTGITTLSAQTATKKESCETIYICPKHPDKMIPRSGKCPKCGMDMNEMKWQKKEEITNITFLN